MQITAGDKTFWIDWDVPVAMEDGVVLSADVYRPLEGRHPVVLTYGPYAKGLAFQEGYQRQWSQLEREAPEALEGSTNAYQNWEAVDPEKWVPDGYACVRVDSRGAGRSEGFMDVWTPREFQDLYQCIECAAAQSWSTGKVGLLGISYYAQNQWQVAALNPPHLTAMIPWEGACDWYREVFYHGGMLSGFASSWYPRQVVSVQHGVGDRGWRNPNTGEAVSGPQTLSPEELARNRSDLPAEIKKHPLNDSFHSERTPELSRISVPLLSSANWGGQGLHPRGNFEGFMGASSTQKWLDVHGDTHFTCFYNNYGLPMQKRFFDHFLKGENNGWENEPRVRLQIRHSDGRFVERHEREWPLARTAWTPYHLDLSSLGFSATPPGEAQSLDYSAAGDGVTFSTVPSKAPLELTGPVAVKLFISSSSIDADIFLVLQVFDPEGKEVVFQGSNDRNTPIGLGWLRASHRRLDPDRSRPWRPYHRHDRLEPLTPGEIYELDVEIWPTSIVVEPGYRLALNVRGRDYEYRGEVGEEMRSLGYKGCGPFVHNDPDDRPPQIFGGEVTIHSGPNTPSHILLPVIPTT